MERRLSLEMEAMASRESQLEEAVRVLRARTSNPAAVTDLANQRAAVERRKARSAESKLDEKVERIRELDDAVSEAGAY